METIYLNESAESNCPCVSTIGFFDGVHVGHRYLINKVVAKARCCHLASAVVTFAVHPRQILQPGWHPQLLTTLSEKCQLLEQTGIDRLVVLPFDAAMASMPARQFMEAVLLRQIGVRTLVIGYDNRFGHRGKCCTEGFSDYVMYGREMGMDVVQGDPVDADGLRVSSSLVRRLLLSGDVACASACLGRPYQLTGTVVSGCHVGTGLGFPTANLQLSDVSKLIPASGAYAVRVSIEGETKLRCGMMNIGCRPTFDGHHQTLEVHILDFSGDVYGRQLTVLFVDRLRAEMRFTSAAALAAQLHADVLRAEEVLQVFTH